jgi:hypothetical protein
LALAFTKGALQTDKKEKHCLNLSENKSILGKLLASYSHTSSVPCKRGALITSSIGGESSDKSVEVASCGFGGDTAPFP